MCNFADDNTLYACDISLFDLMTRLESSAEELIKWFKYNYMKLNESKCHLLIGGYKHEVVIANIGTAPIIEENESKLLGIHIDKDKEFDKHVESIYKNASKKVNALLRQCKILPFYKRRLLMKAFFDSQFVYSSLVWMFHSRELNYKLNKLHHRALQIVY